MQIEPGEYIGIARVLADPADSATYFVQAKIRNARTGSLIATVNLTDRGSGIFSNEYLAPSVDIGKGLYIVITSTVYTDSGYTALSDAYARESQTYLVSPRMQHLGGGGGPGSDFYRKIFREMFKEFLVQFIKAVPKFDATPIAEAIAAAQESKGTALTENQIEALILRHKPQMEKFDYQTILTAIGDKPVFEWKEEFLQSVHKAIAEKPVTEVPPFDKTDILEAIQNTKIDPYVEAITKSMSESAGPILNAALAEMLADSKRKEPAPEPVIEKSFAQVIREIRNNS